MRELLDTAYLIVSKMRNNIREKRWLRVLIGELGLLLVMATVGLIVLSIPTKTALETTGYDPEVFQKLGENNGFEEKFVASGNGLNRVDVLFKNPNLASRDELKLILRDGEQNVVAEQEFNGFNLGDTSHARMDFKTVENSANQSFTLQIKKEKIVDGLLSFGVKDNHLDFVQYYSQANNENNGWLGVKQIAGKIIDHQLIVILLPMILWGWWLW